MHVFNTLWVIFGTGLILVLSLRFKINSIVALLVAVLSVGMLAGMDLTSLLHTMKVGLGNTLGELVIIVVFGAVIGKLMVDFGATHQITHMLLARLGLRYVQLSVIIIGLIFGPVMFYEVAFIMLAPLAIITVVEAKTPFLKLAIPAVAVAATVHSLFPPQPGPVVLANAYGADMGMVYIYDVLVTIPNVICAGLILPKFLGNLERPMPSLLKADQPVDMNNPPSFDVSVLVPPIPAIIMISTTVTSTWLAKGTLVWEMVNFVGSSPTATSIAMVVAFVPFGTARGHDMQWVMNAFESAVKNIVMVILIIGVGGVLKQTIIDIGTGDIIGMLISHGDTSPYIMTWLVTVLTRLTTGQGVVSATIAAETISAAILDPATGQLVGANPALLALATAVGSNTLTRINDAPFWLFKGHFDLSVKDTLKTWGLLELVNSVVGFIIVLIISMVV